MMFEGKLLRILDGLICWHGCRQVMCPCVMSGNTRPLVYATCAKDIAKFKNMSVHN